jgi:glycosyltransferase involved in cell wall biosynthesis
MPGISVIIPVYNAQKYLVKCVESVQRQTFQDWEVLLVDDGCQDESPRLCDECAAKDDRIRVFHLRKNGGVSNARNLGIDEAKGEYIAFLDVDDRYECRCLETMWSARERAEADSVACAHLNLWSDGTKRPELALPGGVYDEQGIREGIVYPLLGDRLRQPVFNGFIWRYLYTASVIRKHHIRFDGAYLEDELFLMEYFCNAHRLAVIEEPLYRYFQNLSSATHKYMPDFLQVFSNFMKRKEALVERYGLSEARPQWRENSNWAGLLIAIGNEYAPGNDKPIRQKQRTVEEICAMPQFSAAIATLTPEGMGPHKQMVAGLVRGRHFFLLTQMYRLKNRI